MNNSKILQVLKGEKHSVPPFWLMRQAGRYLPEYQALRQRCPSFIRFCLTPEMTLEAALQPLRRYDLDAAILFSDILMVPYGLGQEVDFEEGKGPCLSSIRTQEDISKLTLEGFLEKLEPVFTSVRELRAVLPAEKAVIGFAGAPWTVFAYMVEGKTSRTFSQALQFFYKTPERASSLLDLICQATEIYLEAQIAAGAQIIQLFDSWAGAVPSFLSEPLIYGPTRRLISFLKRKFPEVPLICFPKGWGEKIPYYVETTQTQALSLDAQVDINFLLPHLPSSLVLQGGLDPQVLVAGGNLLEKEVLRLTTLLNKHPYIFNLGHGIVPETPPEHVTALIKILRSFQG